jgi:hypothetical protein
MDGVDPNKQPVLGSSNQAQIRTMINLGLVIFFLSLLATIFNPTILLLLEEGEITYSHLDDWTVFILTYLIFGTPIYAAGVGAAVLFMVIKRRRSHPSSLLTPAIAFLVLSVVLTALAVWATRQFVMYFISLL